MMRFVKVVFTKVHKKLQCGSFAASALLFVKFLLFVPMRFFN